ncbi:DegT/DnrJ/EryC1/StrS family aminotransferase [Umezawaea tangerina]|uniref:dTDP-4-amino-4,6-dideoxygalactose transaminase n=1 Tax=Umezawaea tangerina TaxID=84725 RepID=A0A2T0SZR2_9PSEU|nr:DegT/DnrJ/EryC1/StrS family aminotransferase [Umezawaea tangerina]PRY38908.1 dTDP-4-amino-4,6-dideoxygalactose transaminase [Umezawaea tangerina]
MRPLPFFPPAAFEQEREATLEMIRRIGLDPAQRFVLGPAVTELEEEISRETGARYAIACATGSSALALALAAVGVEPGAEVVVPAFGCQPIAGMVVGLGGVPVFADVDPRTLVLDPAAAETAVTSRTTAVVPTHIFATMADMPAFRTMAHDRGLTLVEDAAVAYGAALDGKAAGRWGDAGVFSHAQFKPLGGIGEGGVVVTDDDGVAARCRASRDGDRPDGWSGGMDEMTARFLLRRRRGFTARMRRKAEIARRYTDAFAPLVEAGLLTLPAAEPAPGRFCHVYALLTDRRDDLAAHLREQGIGTHVYYPVPLPRQPAFARFAGRARFPNAEAVGNRNLAIPVWPGLDDEDVDRIIAAVKGFFASAVREQPR